MRRWHWRFSPWIPQRRQSLSSETQSFYWSSCKIRISGRWQKHRWKLCFQQGYVFILGKACDHRESNLSGDQIWRWCECFSGRSPMIQVDLCEIIWWVPALPSSSSRWAAQPRSCTSSDLLASRNSCDVQLQNNPTCDIQHICGAGAKIRSGAQYTKVTPLSSATLLRAWYTGWCRSTRVKNGRVRWW